MKKLLLLLVLLCPLVGCVPAVLLASTTGAATVGGAVIYDKRSVTTMNQDHNARAIAQYRLDHDLTLKYHSHISVSVFNNAALLVGQAQTPEIRDRAYQIVSKVENVKRVYNQITVGPASSSLQRANDAWVTTKVRARMLGTSQLHSTNLKVVTENGVVYLMGVVTRYQADLATDAARRISGVTKVVKIFEYEQ